MRAPSLLLSMAVVAFVLRPTSTPSDCIGGDFVPDMHECPCYVSGGEWPLFGPFLPNVPDVAERTLGTTTSCIEHGGQPYWQMQLYLTSPDAAHHAAHYDPDFIDRYPRSSWCTEVIGYWHNVVDVPRNDGYVSEMHPSKYVWGIQELREWYQIEMIFGDLLEPDGSHGRWAWGSRLDYENFIPGVNGPCPGAYQVLDSYDTLTGEWIETDGIGHSQLIDSIIVHYLNGVVRQIDVCVIDGNIAYDSGPDVYGSDADWAHVRTTWYRDILQYTTLGDVSLKNSYVYKIRGWGIDLDDDGNPYCDDDRIITRIGPYFGNLVLPNQDEDEDSTGMGKFAAYFATTSAQKSISTNSTLVTLGGASIPIGEGQSWTIPAGMHPVGSHVEIDVDLLADYPYPVGGVTIDWKDGAIPPAWEVWWSAQNVQIHTLTIAEDANALPSQMGLGSVPIPVVFDPDTAFTVRYVKLRIPNPVPGQYEITSFDYNFRFGVDDDDSGDVYFDTHEECDCGSPGDPHGDITRDGVYNVFDVVACVDYAFRSGQPAPREVTCPYDRADVTCDDVINVFDVVALVDVSFRAGNPAMVFCNPCM